MRKPTQTRAARWPLLPLLLLFCVIAPATSLLSGCNGKAISSYRSHEEIRDPRTGKVLWAHDTGSGAQQELPPGAAGPTTQSVGEDGASSSVAGTHEKPLAAYGIEQRQTIIYGGGVFLVIAAAGALWLGQKMLAVCLAGAGVVLFAVGMLAASPLIAAVSGVLVLAGLIWAGASVYRNHRENQLGVASALKLGTQGKASEAVAALRETPVARHVRKTAGAAS